MLERGWGDKETSKALHISVGSVHNIQRAHLPNVKLGCRGRPRVMTRAIKSSCVLEVTRRRVPCRWSEKCAQFFWSTSVNSVRRTLCRPGLSAHVKEKKPHLFRKNIKDHLEFVRIHQH